jgi:hypothetical protein
MIHDSKTATSQAQVRHSLESRIEAPVPGMSTG